ncbi:MAG: EamA family transporter [Myxococcota bacterium]
MTDARPTSAWRAAPWVLGSIGAQSCAAAMFKFAASKSEELLVLGVAYIVALGLLGMQAVFWLKVLGHMELSRAYPFMALVIPLNLVFAVVAFGEAVSARQLLGVALIVGGVVLVARGST